MLSENDFKTDTALTPEPLMLLSWWSKSLAPQRCVCVWEQNLYIPQTVRGTHSALSGFLFACFYVKLSRREAWPLWRLIVAFIVYSLIPMMLPGTFSYPDSSLILLSFKAIYKLVKSPAGCCAPIEITADLLYSFHPWPTGGNTASS